MFVLSLAVGYRPEVPRPFNFSSPVQTGLPRELAELLTRAEQPELVSPGGGDQAQRYHPGKVFAILWRLLSPA